MALTKAFAFSNMRLRGGSRVEYVNRAITAIITIGTSSDQLQV